MVYLRKTDAVTENVPEDNLDEATIEAMEAQFEEAGDAEVEAPTEPDFEKLLAERTEDLQRLQAEYVNYKRRVDRDRGVARQHGVEAVVGDMLPILDAIAAAKQHEELTGGFKLVADELEKVAAKYSLVAYGAVGDVFDPQLHEAMMMMPGREDQTEPEIGEVLQAGFSLGERIIRHARVIVAEPQS